MKTKKLIILILTVCSVIAVFLFVAEALGDVQEIDRNAYGDGKKTEVYEVYVPEEDLREKIEIEVSAQEYTREEIQEIFQKITGQMDKIVLGKNQSFDRVEYDLQLVERVPEYPVEITWELDSYSVMNVEGRIRSENVVEEGTLVEVRGILSYGGEQAIYVRHAMVYPRTREGAEQLLYEIQKVLEEKELATREEERFRLPTEIAGKKVQWSQKKEGYGYYVILIGVILAIFFAYKEKEDKRQELLMRERELRKAYPGLVSKLTMLLGTGMTVKQAWQRIVENDERHDILYKEMMATLHEMKGGVSEGEAYERFGKRCGDAVYLKFGTLLSQNARKGSRGLLDMLRMEAIQSFENRKSQAKQAGEEAGTKLLIPMMGMLVVVLIMVMIPAFLTI